MNQKGNKSQSVKGELKPELVELCVWGRGDGTGEALGC